MAFDDLDVTDTLELLGKAPDPVWAARLTVAQVTAALKRAQRRHVAEKAAIRAALRAEQLTQPEIIVDAYAATTRAQVAVLTVLNEQSTSLEQG